MGSTFVKHLNLKITANEVVIQKKIGNFAPSLKDKIHRKCIKDKRLV